MARSTGVETIAGVAKILALMLVVTALYFARDVFIPLTLALLLAFLLSPLVNRLQRWGVANIMAVVTTAGLTFLLLATGVTLIGRELGTLVSDLPQYKGEFVAKARAVAGMRSGMGESLDELAEEVTSAIENAGEQQSESTSLAASKADSNSGSSQQLAEGEGRSPFSQWVDKWLGASTSIGQTKEHDGTSAKAPLYVTQIQEGMPLGSWATTAGSVMGPLGTAGLVTVFALFMLVYRDDLRDRIILVVSRGNYVTTTEALHEVGKRISRYLVAQTIVNTSYGFVLAAGLFGIGRTMAPEGEFPNFILWGVLATCMRFVPYLGPIVSAIFPLAISLAVFPGYAVFLAVLGLIVTLELLSNNILEPWLYGTSTGISAVAIIISAVFWGWLWGPVGLLLSTPLTVCLVVLGRHVPQFKVFSTLFGEDLEIDPALRFYQRLLADDDFKAQQLINGHLKENNFAATCDEVLIPTLKRLKNDQHKEVLTGDEATELFDSIAAIVGKTEWSNGLIATDDSATQENENSAAIEQLPIVVGCPAHQLHDELVLELLQRASVTTCQLEIMDDELVPSAMAKAIAARNPAAAVITLVPQGGFAQARFLCRSIRAEGYQGPLIVACFGKFKHYDRLFVKFHKSGATSMTTTFAQTCSKLDSVVRQAAKKPTLRQPRFLRPLPASSSTSLKVLKGDNAAPALNAE